MSVGASSDREPRAHLLLGWRPVLESHLLAVLAHLSLPVRALVFDSVVNGVLENILGVLRNIHHRVVQHNITIPAMARLWLTLLRRVIWIVGAVPDISQAARLILAQAELAEGVVVLLAPENSAIVPGEHPHERLVPAARCVGDDQSSANGRSSASRVRRRAVNIWLRQGHRTRDEGPTILDGHPLQPESLR